MVERLEREVKEGSDVWERKLLLVNSEKKTLQEELKALIKITGDREEELDK